MPLGDFNKVDQEKGWIGWGFDVLVQKPVSWGFSSVTSLLNWSKTVDKFVVVSVVKVSIVGMRLFVMFLFIFISLRLRQKVFKNSKRTNRNKNHDGI